MLLRSAVSNLFAQGTLLLLIVNPGLTFRLPFRFRNRAAAAHEAQKPNNEVPLLLTLCSLDQLKTVLSQLPSAQDATAQAAVNDKESTDKLLTSNSRDVAENNEVKTTRPKNGEQLTPSPANNRGLGVDVSEGPKPPAALKLNITASLDGNDAANAPEGSIPAAAASGRRRRWLKDLADSAMELARAGPGVHGDMAGAALELAGSLAGQKLRAMADSGGQALGGVAGPVGRLSARALGAAGDAAAKALEVAGAGSGTVLRRLGSAGDSIADFLNIG